MILNKLFVLLYKILCSWSCYTTNVELESKAVSTTVLAINQLITIYAVVEMLHE